jgi:hypothetical protein
VSSGDTEHRRQLPPPATGQRSNLDLKFFD